LRRQLRIEDLSRLAEIVRDSDRPQAIYQALELMTGEVIGHRLFTVMRFNAEASEVERVHSSRSDVYPVGGRKKKADTAWAEHVLHGMRVFRGTTPEDIRAAFDDHATILGLGLGSVLNVPVVFQGRCVGTMNLLHEAGWYRREDENTGAQLGAFLVPALIGASPQAQRPIA